MNAPDNRRPPFQRTEKDVVWNASRTTCRCRNCGNPVMEVGPDNFLCINDPECANEMQAERAA